MDVAQFGLLVCVRIISAHFRPRGAHYLRSSPPIAGQCYLLENSLWYGVGIQPPGGPGLHCGPDIFSIVGNEHSYPLSHHFMANRQETVESVRLIFWGSTITADGDCTHEIKRCLLFGRKVMSNLDSILKSRDITLPTKVRLVKAMVFPVVMYACESWTVKKAERQRIDAFYSWCWRILLRIPWTARISNWSILKEINLEYSL